MLREVALEFCALSGMREICLIEHRELQDQTEGLTGTSAYERFQFFSGVLQSTNVTFEQAVPAAIRSLWAFNI